MSGRWILLASAAALLAVACDREQRRFQDLSAAAQPAASISMSPLRLGAPSPEQPPPGPYDDNAWAINEGKRLFEWFNCTGCHAHGGGDMGPPLMDARWIYGSEPENIYATIMEGRPNGMPSFRGRIPEAQVWQLVAYVRSLSGLVSREAARRSRRRTLLGRPPLHERPSSFSDRHAAKGG